MEALKKNSTDKYEFIKVTLNETDHPIAFKNKVEEMIESGLSKKEACNYVATTPFEMEIYYSKFQGLFLVESEAVESTEIFNPYDGSEMVENED